MPATHASKLKQTYAQILPANQQRNQQIPKAQQDQIDIFIGLLPKAAKVLELGSGTGRDSRYFADKGLYMT